MSERLDKLMAMLTRDPNDPFLLYAIGLEHKKAGAYPTALEYLQRTLEKDPGYVVAYFQMGQTHTAAGDRAAAKQAYTVGAEAAKKKGDHHAAEEMMEAMATL